MRNVIILSTALAALSFGYAGAQEAPMPGMKSEGASALPKGCQSAAKGMDMAGMKGMGDMKGMDMGSMSGMDDAQKESMAGMMKMHGPMMAAHTIKNPDLAFTCGMIAHHQGAIEMSKVELKYGKDEQAKAMATKIIADQEKEIAEMTAWVEKTAKK